MGPCRTDEKMYELLAQNFARYGFPMMHDGVETAELPIEELIVRTLKEMPNPRIILGIPIILFKNSVDVTKLYGLAIAQDLVNQVGWILEETDAAFTRINTNKQYLKELSTQLETLKKEGERVVGMDITDWFISYARTRQTRIGKKWKILSGFTEDSFSEELERRCKYAKET